jgi:hypothetical protein
MDFNTAVEAFPWESKDQKEGYLALVQYLRGFGVAPEAPIDAKSAFFIQKNIDSHEYWREMVGDQISSLQAELISTKELFDNTIRLLNQMELTIKAQSDAIQVLTVAISTHKMGV